MTSPSTSSSASTRSSISRRCPTIRSVRWRPTSPTTSTITPRSGWPGWPRRQACAASSTPRPARSTARPVRIWSTEDAPLRPLTPYAESKVRVEDDVAAMADDGFSPVFLRNATAFGFSPRLRADIVLNNLVGHAVLTGEVKVLSDGTPWRPLVHAQDIARAFATCLVAPIEAIHCQAYNVGYRAQQPHRRRDRPGRGRGRAGLETGDHRGERCRSAVLPGGLLCGAEEPGLRSELDDSEGAAELYRELHGGGTHPATASCSASPGWRTCRGCRPIDILDESMRRVSAAS